MATTQPSPGRRRTVMEFAHAEEAWLGLHLLVITNRYMQTVYDDIERRHQLQRDEIAVILCLSITTATTAQQVARYTGRPKNSISRAVASLVEHQLVRRQDHPDDGRAIALQLTTDGRRIFDNIRFDFAARDAEVLGGLTTEEQSEFVRLVLKVSDTSSIWSKP